MKLTFPKQAKELSSLLKAAGYSKKNPFVLTKRVQVSISIFTRKYDCLYPYKPTRIWPDGRTVSFSGSAKPCLETQERLGWRWIKMKYPERIYDATPTLEEQKLHWSQAPESCEWEIEDLSEQVLKEIPKKQLKPFECDFYSVEMENRRKYIHIHGYLYHNGELWSLVEAVWLRMPLKDFVKAYKAEGIAFVDRQYEVVKQYQTETFDSAEALRTTKTFFEGRHADKILPFNCVTEETPIGHFINPS